MIETIHSGRTFRVTGDTRNQIEDELSAAEVLMRPYAKKARQGIVITRLGPGEFIVCLDASVAYGMTEERDT